MVPDGSGGYSVGLSVNLTQGEFTDVFDFVGPGDLAVFGGSLIAANIEFTDIDINGQDFGTMPNGNVTFAMLGDVLLSGPFVLTISGDVLTSGATYAGQINANPLPEPTGLALVVLGLFAAGFARWSRVKSLGKSIGKAIGTSV